MERGKERTRRRRISGWIFELEGIHRFEEMRGTVFFYEKEKTRTAGVRQGGTAGREEGCSLFICLYLLCKGGFSSLEVADSAFPRPSPRSVTPFDSMFISLSLHSSRLQWQANVAASYSPHLNTAWNFSAVRTFVSQTAATTPRSREIV